MRNPKSPAGEALSALPNVTVLRLDVTDKSTIVEAVSATISKYGGLDAVINNAGYGLAGALELATEEQIQRQYATNVFGPVYVMQAVLPHFREKRSGVICNVTSVGGRLGLPFNSLYHGTKFGLEGISESVAQELAPMGIKVKVVEPGGVKTDFSGRSLVMASNENVNAYDGLIEKAVAGFMSLTGGGSEPELIGEAIFDAVTDDSDRLRYPAGEDAKAMLAKRYATSDEQHIKDMIKQFQLVDEPNTVNGQ